MYPPKEKGKQMQNFKNFFAGFGTFSMENAAIAIALGIIYTIAWTPDSFREIAPTFFVMFSASFVVVMVCRMINLFIIKR